MHIILRYLHDGDELKSTHIRGFERELLVEFHVKYKLPSFVRSIGLIEK